MNNQVGGRWKQRGPLKRWYTIHHYTVSHIRIPQLELLKSSGKKKKFRELH